MKQQRNRWIAAALVCGLLLAGCGAADSGQDSTGVTQSGSAAAAAEPVSREIFAMDTYMTVTAYGEPAQEAVDAAVSEIRRLDALLSIGESGSEISMLNDSGTARVSDDTGVMIDKALELYRDTGGAFDLTILPPDGDMGLYRRSISGSIGGRTKNCFAENWCRSADMGEGQRNHYHGRRAENGSGRHCQGVYLQPDYGNL